MEQLNEPNELSKDIKPVKQESKLYLPSAIADNLPAMVRLESLIQRLEQLQR